MVEDNVLEIMNAMYLCGRFLNLVEINFIIL